MCMQLNKNHPFYVTVHVVLIDIVDAYEITVWFVFF